MEINKLLEQLNKEQIKDIATHCCYCQVTFSPDNVCYGFFIYYISDSSLVKVFTSAHYAVLWGEAIMDGINLINICEKDYETLYSSRL